MGHPIFRQPCGNVRDSPIFQSGGYEGAKELWVLYGSYSAGGRLDIQLCISPLVDPTVVESTGGNLQCMFHGSPKQIKVFL